MTEHDNGADLRERLDYAMNDLSAPDHLTEGVLSVGRRLRRRRRIAAGGAGVAAAAAVTAIVVASLSSSPTTAGTDVATEPSAPKASADGNGNGNGDQSGLPSPGPDDVEWTYPDRPDGWWNMPATTMATELAELLPDGMQLTDAETTNTDRAPGEAKRELEGYLTAVLRPAGSGPGKVNMIFYPPNSGEPVPPPETLPDGGMRMFGQGPTPAEMTSCDPDWIVNPEDCTEILGTDGNPIGRILDSTGNGVRSLSVELLTADGAVVMINVANTLADKWPMGATPSADEVPLDLAELRAIAENPVWTSYED